MNELWKQAQKLAEENYEKEYGACTWDDADKYEREDWVFAEYEKLGGFELDKKKQQLEEARKELEEVRGQTNILTTGQWFDKIIAIHKQMYALEKEIKDMCERNPKTGRFVSTKKANNNNETINTNSNMKGNDTMNKTNVKTNRMETLKANGIDTTNFFDLSMRVPMGAEVKILVNGQEMIIPATNGRQLSESEMIVKKIMEANEAYVATNGNVIKTANGLIGNYVGVPTIISSNGDICNAETGEVLVMANDPIAQSIIEDGYVKNLYLFRRWIFAQTMKLLEYIDRRNPNRKGWEAGFKDLYGYEYQFKMMADELHTLAKLQKEDPEYFAERTMFFNGKIAIALLEDYLYRLKKYTKKQMRENPRTYHGQAYCKLARYGNVLVTDLNDKVYLPICRGIADVRGAVASGDYNKIEKTFRDFMNKLYNKLPYETPKCAVFKDAFKGIGAFESLRNGIRFHGLIIKGCRDKYESEAYLTNLLDGAYRNEVWRFHQLLVDTIAYNNFDLRKSIAEGHCAPNTVSTRANAYRR